MNEFESQVAAMPGSRYLRWDWPALAVIAACTVFAYGLCVGGAFVYDDVHSVQNNRGVASLANIPSFFVDVGLFSSLDCRMYRPILLVSFAIDGFLGGMQPWMFKLTNLLLHTTAVWLVFGIARRLGVARPAAVLAAVLFGVHPLASEAVNTISGRSNVLMVVALLAAVRCHFAAMEGARSAVVATTGFGIVAVGCKEPGMILPVLLVILEYLHRIRGGRPASSNAILLRVLPSVVVVVGYLVVRSHFLGSATAGMSQWQGSDVTSGHGRGMATQLASMTLLLPRTLLQVVVPQGLTMDPVVPFTDDVFAPSVWGCAALLLGITVAGLSAPRRRPVVFLGTCLAWGTALPWVLKPLNLPFLEHRFYGGLAGLALVVSGVLPRVELAAVRLPARLGVAGVVLVGIVLSAVRTLDFSSEKRLWTVELAHNPESRVAMAGMAVCLMHEGKFATCRPFLEILVETYPNRRDARLNLAEVALKLDDPDAALKQAEYLVEHWPDNPFYCLLESRALAAVGLRSGDPERFDQSVAAALRANEVAVPKGLVFRTAASARRAQGNFEQAIALLDRSIAAGLDHSDVLLDRSELLTIVGRSAEARRDLERARISNPFDGRVLAAWSRARDSVGTKPADLAAPR